MTRTRALLVALAVEAAAPRQSRFARFCRRKTAYVAALAVQPDEYRMYGLVDAPDGLDVLWRRIGASRLANS